MLPSNQVQFPGFTPLYPVGPFVEPETSAVDTATQVAQAALETEVAAPSKPHFDWLTKQVSIIQDVPLLTPLRAADAFATRMAIALRETLEGRFVGVAHAVNALVRFVFLILGAAANLAISPLTLLHALLDKASGRSEAHGVPAMMKALDQLLVEAYLNGKLDGLDLSKLPGHKAARDALMAELKKDISMKMDPQVHRGFKILLNLMPSSFEKAMKETPAAILEVWATGLTVGKSACYKFAEACDKHRAVFMADYNRRLEEKCAAIEAKGKLSKKDEAFLECAQALSGMGQDVIFSEPFLNKVLSGKATPGECAEEAVTLKDIFASDQDMVMVEHADPAMRVPYAPQMETAPMYDGFTPLPASFPVDHLAMMQPQVIGSHYVIAGTDTPIAPY